MLRVKSKLQCNVGIISKIRYQITPQVVKNLFHSMILSNLRYCNITWCYGNFTIRTSLQAQCNKFLRAGFRLHPRTCVKYLLQIYKLPSLNELSFKRLANCMHKIILSQYPPQFIDFFARSHHRYSTSSSSVSPFIPTFHRLETTKQALSYRACKTWNSIPLDIKYKTISPPRNQDTNENHRRIIRPLRQFSAALNDYILSVSIINPLF